eukprot:scaffold1655_cov247-Pinguiococcus_pyrenoidosus.AAC.16
MAARHGRHSRPGRDFRPAQRLRSSSQRSAPKATKGPSTQQTGSWSRGSRPRLRAGTSSRRPVPPRQRWPRWSSR